MSPHPGGGPASGTIIQRAARHGTTNNWGGVVVAGGVAVRVRACGVRGARGGVRRQAAGPDDDDRQDCQGAERTNETLNRLGTIRDRRTPATPLSIIHEAMRMMLSRLGTAQQMTCARGRAVLFP